MKMFIRRSDEDSAIGSSLDLVESPFLALYWEYKWVLRLDSGLKLNRESLLLPDHTFSIRDGGRENDLWLMRDPPDSTDRLLLLFSQGGWGLEKLKDTTMKKVREGCERRDGWGTLQGIYLAEPGQAIVTQRMSTDGCAGRPEVHHFLWTGSELRHRFFHPEIWRRLKQAPPAKASL